MPLPAGIDPSQLPSFSLTPANDDNSKPSPIIGGLASGFHELLGLGGSAVSGIGALEGFQNPVGQDFASRQATIAARVGRPDLEVSPWQPGGASIVPWLEYQVGKMVPTLAGYAAATAAAPEAAVPAGLARIGATLPEFLGGAGLEAGAGFAARRAALDAGTGFGKFVLGGGAFGAATGFGQAIQSAVAKPGGVTASDAVQAAAESPIYAAAGLLEPGFLRGALSGAEGTLVGRVIARGLSGAAVGSIQSGTLAALDQTFRPDLSSQDKMANIVDAAVTGASVGGVLGGATGLRALKRTNPAAIDNDTLGQVVDQAVSQPLGLPAPPTFVDSMGRAATGSGGDAILRATPAEPAAPAQVDVPQAAPTLFGPEAVPDRGAIPGSTIVVGQRDEGGRFTNKATGVEQPPVAPDDTSRAFRNFTDQELASASNALANKREAEGKLSSQQNEIASSINDELDFRRRNGALTNQDVSASPVEAVSADANREGTGKQTSAAPASASLDDIQSRVSELTQGLRLPASLKDKLAAARSENDIQDIVHDEVIVDGKGGKMRDALAQRVGMLDDEGRPTSLADEVSARKTPAGEQAPTPAADAMFLQQWKDDVKTTGQKDPAVRALNPTNESDAQLQIYRALGDQGVKSDADGLEKLAQKYGVIDDNKQLTPLALEMAKRDPIPTEDSVNAAKAQGFNGAAASMFDRGVQSYTSGGEQLTKFDSAKQGEAYQAGVKWAEETNSVPRGALKKYEPSGHTGEITDEQRALGQPVEVKKGTIPPEVRQGQLVNEAIDNIGLNPTKDESDIAQLKTMVRSGDIEGAMEGLRRVQRGESLFEEPPRAPPEPIKGETVTPGAPKAPREPEMVPTKATTRAEAERAIRNHELSQSIEAAHQAGEISGADKVRLVNHLRQGRVGEVTKVIGEPTGRIGGKIATAAARAERRSQLLQALQDHLANSAREAEVPELNVDRNGVLKAAKGDLQSDWVNATPEDRENAASVISYAVQHPTDAKGMVQQIADQGGELGAMAARMKKFVPDDLYLRVMLPQEMNELEREINASEGHPAAPITGKLWGLWHAFGEDRGSVDHTIYLHVGMPHPAVALHEIVHAIAGINIEAKSPIGKQIRSIFDRFKDELQKRGDYAGVDAHEFLSEFISRKSVRDFVKSLGDGKESVFQRMWSTIRNMLGMPKRDWVEKLFDLTEAAGRNPIDGYGRPIQAKLLDRSPPAMASKTQDTIGKVVDAVDKHIDVEGAKGILRRSQLYATSIHHITEFFGKPWFNIKIGDRDVNGVVDRERATDFREAIQQRHAQLLTDVMDRVYQLEHSDKDAFKNLNRLMQLSEFGIHPARNFDAQIDAVKNNPALKPVVEKANSLYRSLQTKDHVGMYDDLRKFNDILMLSQTAMSLHDHVSTDKITQGTMPEFASSPMDRFMNEQAREGYGLQEAHDFWNRELDAQVAAIKLHVDAFEKSPPTKMSASEARMMSAGIGSLRDQADAIAGIRDRLANVPYFNLGRDGDYFVDMKLKVGKDGKVDPAALATAAERLEQFGRVISPQVHPENDQGHIFFRVDSTVAQANLIKAAEQLQKEGVVRGNHTDEKTGATSFAIKSGKRTDDRIRAALAGQWSNRLAEEVAANQHLKPEDREFLINTIRGQALDLMPDNTLAKVMAHRESVPGYDPDMIRSYNSRAKIGVDALAGMAVARKITDSYANMRAAVKQAQTTPSARMSIAQRNGMTEVVDELSKRDKQFAEQPRGSHALDQLQAMSGAFFLSANLAYPAVNLIQVPMIALPELGSRYGFLKAAQTLAKVTPDALKILHAIGKTGLKISASRAADAVLTTRALKDAGISGAKAEFLMQVANRGGIDIGGPSRELARAARGLRGSKIDQGLRIASAMGYYSETLSRLVVALASHALHPEGTPVEEAALNTVRTLKESMWDYSSPNTSRMLSRSGFLGKLTPLATQFMKYTAMLNEKLYREVHQAVGGDKEAQRFLMQHLAMTTVFAGALGLPFASVFASTYDRLKDWIDPAAQPSDIQASFRNGLADMFGKNAAEIIARGTPRAAGIDLSTRVGEQDILPFSKFIADRRDLKDSLKDLEGRAWGAPSSMMLNMATGAGRVAQGDIEGGFRQMLPLGLSSMVKAYQMTDQGYADSKGNVLPMDPTAQDILAQAIGFNPAQNAEYNEARFDQMQRQGLLARQSGQLRSRIVDAIMSGDREQARPLIQQAMEFDRANPAYGVLKGVEGSIKRRQQAQAIAQSSQAPLGVSPHDVTAPQFTRFANVEFHAH